MPSTISFHVFAAVVGAVDVRVHVVEPERVDRRVGRQRIEPAGIDGEHFHEGGQLGAV